MTLIFCGLQSSGKSTLGALIAEQLKWKFIDVDELIERAYFKIFSQNYSCRDIYQHKGALFFRALEKEQIALLHEANAIISLGGGAFLDHENITHLKQIGKIIYLKTDLKILYERTLKKGLPAYLKNDNFEEFKETANLRIPLFEEHASLILETDKKSIEQILMEIMKIIYGQ